MMQAEQKNGPKNKKYSYQSMASLETERPAICRRDRHRPSIANAGSNASHELLTGFTIIELLVVIFIITLISSTILINYRAGRSNQELNLAAQKLAFDIKKTQALAIGGTNIHGSDTPAYNCGYGINIPSEPTSEYTIFLDNDCNYVYNAGDIEIEKITLPTQIQISDFSTTLPSLNIVFTPPQPTIKINNDSTLTSVNITLNIINDSLTIKTIFITTGGQVNIQ